MATTDCKCEKFSGKVGTGVCTSLDNGDVSCKCNVGFSGPTCVIDDCKGRCLNGGKCKTNETSVYCE